ncbi:MAG: hypothetical protein FWF18_03085 [Dehalococcoidia bacterium]|nr:hypothetical protein [Dehalococcoidia bacterium]
MSVQDENRLQELLQLKANHIPNSASAIDWYDAEIEELQNRIARERSQKEAEQAQHSKALETHGERQITLLQKQLEEVRQANIAIKTIADDSKRDAKTAKIFAWIGAIIGAVSLIVAIID